MKYIGYRGTTVPIEKDWYYGSEYDISHIEEFYKYVFADEWRSEIAKRFTKIVFEVCNSAEQSKQREIYWIKEYDAFKRKDFYNRTPGVDGINYEIMTPEEREAKTKQMSNAVRIGWANRSMEKKNTIPKRL